MTSPTCCRCGKTPSQIEEYVEMGVLESMEPDQLVREGEGTYNPETNRFACTDCYIAMGQPSSRTGWRAP